MRKVVPVQFVRSPWVTMVVVDEGGTRVALLISRCTLMLQGM